jgi:coiled-coil domain-containing protein 40
VEKESVLLQAQINEVALAKAALMDEIVETERQGLLWQKKIQLDKETRDALDPSVGQLETQNMEKEIHRMELRYDTLLREQERLSLEMESAILKRSSIALRYSPKTNDTRVSSTAKKQEYTQSTIKKKIAYLKREGRSLAEETLRYEGAVSDKRSQLEEITAQLDQLAMEFSAREESNSKLQSKINDSMYEKQLRQERVAYRQKYFKRLKELIAVGIDTTQILPIERKLLSANQELDNVRDIITELQTAHPHLSQVLDLVAAMTDSGIK